MFYNHSFLFVLHCSKAHNILDFHLGPYIQEFKMYEILNICIVIQIEG